MGPNVDWEWWEGRLKTTGDTIGSEQRYRVHSDCRYAEDVRNQFREVIKRICIPLDLE